MSKIGIPLSIQEDFNMLKKVTSFGVESNEIGDANKLNKISTENNKVRPVFGIDLGTTNSAISVIARGKDPETIELTEGRLTMPSCVLYHNGKFIVGKKAYEQRYKSNAVYSVKRLMQNPTAKVKVEDDGKIYEFTPAEISAEILKGLVAETNGMYGEVKDVVVTVPAYFDQNGVNATREACELAGLNLIGIANEPTAASLCYELKPEDGNSKDVLVYDLGGGTFDVTIIRIQDLKGQQSFDDIYGDDDEDDDNHGLSEKSTMNSKAVSTLGISGDTHLGGDDYDKILLRILGKRLKEYGVCLSKFTKEYKEELLLRLEKYKKGDPMAYYQVSINTVDVDGVKHDLLVPLTKDDFKLAAEILFKKTSDIINKLLAETKNNVDSIVLTGGSTKSYWIREEIKNYYKQYDVNDALSPDLSVSQGAAIQGYVTKFGDESVQIYDILPLTIGILSDNRVKSFIPKSTPLPVVKTMIFTTDMDNQTDVGVELFQGDSKFKDECVSLGVINISGIKKCPAGVPDLRVTISITADRLMKCTATIDGIEKEIILNLAGESANTDSGKIRRTDKTRTLESLKRSLDLMTAEDAAIYKEMLKDCEDNGKTTIDDLKEFLRKHREKKVDAD